MSYDKSLAQHFHDRYMQRMENELSLSWTRINIALIALVASIGGYGVVVTRGALAAQMSLVAPVNSSCSVILLHTLASGAVLPLVIYIFILVNQGRYWYRVNEAKIAWCESILLNTVDQGLPINGGIPQSLYQIGNGTSGRLTIECGIKIPLYLTGAVFSALTAWNLSILLPSEWLHEETSCFPVFIPIAGTLLYLVYMSDKRSSAKIPIDNFDEQHPVGEAAGRMIVERLSYPDGRNNKTS